MHSKYPMWMLSLTAKVGQRDGFLLPRGLWVQKLFTYWGMRGALAEKSVLWRILRFISRICQDSCLDSWPYFVGLLETVRWRWFQIENEKWKNAQIMILWAGLSEIHCGLAFLHPNSPQCGGKIQSANGSEYQDTIGTIGFNEVL